MNTVERLLEHKGTDVHTVSADTSVVACARRMHAENIRSLVVEENGKAVGIVTCSDITREVAQEVGNIPNLTVGEVMTVDLLTTTEDQELKVVEDEMIRRHLHHVPVVRGKKVVGLVTREDILARRLEDSKAMNQELEDYIYSEHARIPTDVAPRSGS